MKFVDSVKIHVRSGKGGSGCTSFRREKYIPMGGPDGGDGGKGGDIYFVGDQNRNTLLDLSFQQHQHAGNGSNGMGKDRHGKNGQDLKIHVPLGTMLKEQETGEILLEVLESEEYLLFKGGRGGRGNARFKTSTNRAPEHHQPGEEGVLVESGRLLRIVSEMLMNPSFRWEDSRNRSPIFLEGTGSSKCR